MNKAKNIAIIFAGGTGQRMNSKPILAYTIEKFNAHNEIDKIILVTLSAWIGYCSDLIEKYRLDKVESIISGGATAQESTMLGLKEADKIYGQDDVIVLIHDGVRPLIDYDTISKDIESVNYIGLQLP